MTAQLPFASAARNPLWPDARWNLTGLFVHDMLILQVFSLLHQRFGCRLNIDSIHGAPQVPWNCGRFSDAPMPTAEALSAMVSTFNDVGIGVFYTLTNHLLEKADLESRDCNRLLESIDNGRGLNGVILASDLLYDYIRRRHPELKLTASIIKVTEELGNGDPEYYRSAVQRFDSVMIHPDDGFDCDLLDQLDRDKIEIMVNENCAFRCPNRVKDYEVMASVLKAGPPGPDNVYMEMERRHCRMPLKRLTSAIQSCNFPAAHMRRVYEMGFRRFKLQGRQDMPATFLFSMLRFAIEPEILAPMIFKAFISGQARNLIAKAVEKTQAACKQAPDGTLAATRGNEGRQEDATSPMPMIVEAPVVKGHGLPTGADAGHPLWPEARWMIEGLFAQQRLIREVLALLADRFDCHLGIDGVYGGAAALWNGPSPAQGPRPSLNALPRIVGDFNDMGIGAYYSFNSRQLTQNDLTDETCNRALDVLDNGSELNGVILASDLLAEHIQSRHPGLKLIASAAGATPDGGGRLVDQYAALTERFDTVALRGEDAFDIGLLEQLDRDRIEIVVNDDAPWRSASAGGSPRPDDGSATPMAAMDADVRMRNFTTAELKRVYDLGYRRFRLQGRSRNTNLFLYDILRYTLEPNLLLPVVFKGFTNDWAREQAAAALDGRRREAGPPRP